MKYPEDDPSLLNPNVLEGHEGSLLMTLCELRGIKQTQEIYPGCHEPRYINPPPVAWLTASREDLVEIKIPYKAIVMLIKVIDKSDDSLSKTGIEILYEEKKLFLFIRPNQWMQYFLPWPEGAFIQK